MSATEFKCGGTVSFWNELALGDDSVLRCHACHWKFLHARRAPAEVARAAFAKLRALGLGDVIGLDFRRHDADRIARTLRRGSNAAADPPPLGSSGAP